MAAMRDPDSQSLHLVVYSISSQSQRLRLLLPFVTVPRIQVRRTNVFGKDNSTAYYLCDPSAERISHIWFRAGSSNFDVAISNHQLLKLLPSPEESCRTLRWNEWGPTCTRWFRQPSPSFNSSAYRSWMYFSNDIPNFLDINNISQNHFDDAGVVLCDFNPRIIRRYHSVSISNHTSNSYQLDAEPKPIQTEETTEEDNSVVTSNLIAQVVVTEEWVLSSPAFTEDVHSCLPFRAIIRKKIENWTTCPIMGAEPVAIFSVSSLIILRHLPH